MYVLIVKCNFKLAHPNDLILYSHLLGTEKKKKKYAFFS